MRDTVNIEFDFEKKFTYKSPLSKYAVNEESFFEKPIDYVKLIEYLKKSRGDIVDFDYNQFKSELTEPKYTISHDGFTSTWKDEIVETKFKYEDKRGIERSLACGARLNEKLGKVDFSSDVTEFDFQLDDESINFILTFFYAERNDTRKKSRAIILTTKTYDDFEYLLKYIGIGLTQYSIDKIITAFNIIFLSASGKRNSLDFLYEQAPLWVITQIQKEVLISDLKTILAGSVDKVNTNEELAVLKIISSFGINSDTILADISEVATVSEVLVIAKAKNGQSETKEENALVSKINFLLEQLLSIDGDNNKTLFQIIYNKIDDRYGQKAFTEFIQIIYLFWLESIYTNKNLEEYKDSHGPNTISYESNKILGFYDQNRSFSIFGNKIISKDTEGRWDKIYEGAKNNLKRLLGMRILEKNPPSKTKVEDFVYHLYEPLELINIDKVEGEMKLPEGHIPAFFLYTFYQKNYWQNLENAATLLLDIITVLSGVGELSQLKYLLYLTRVQKTVRITALGVEISSATINAMITLTNNCDGSEFCRKLGNYLFFLELATLGFDSIVSMRVKKAAKEALDVMTPELRKKHSEIFKSLDTTINPQDGSVRQTARKAFREADAEMIVIKSDLDKRRNDYSVTKIEDGYTLNRDKIIPAYYDKSNKKIVRENLRVESARLLYELRKRAPDKNVMIANVSIKYKGVEYWSFDFLENAGERNYVASNTVGKNPEKIDKDKMYDSSTRQNRHNDTENKMFSFSDEKIAEVLGDINNKQATKITYKDLEISYRIESSFEPCIICKREILMRAEMYNAKFVIYSPEYIKSKKPTPVENSGDFNNYYDQIKKQTR